MFKANAERERIDLPFALGNAGTHVCDVIDGPRQGFGRLRVRQERVCVRVNQDAATLPPNQAAKHTSKVAVVFSEWQIRPHLA